MTYCL